MSHPSEPEYVLGTGADELERLGLQHRLWSDDAHALWRRARVGPGQQVLDVGCGPGYAAFDLAQLAGRASTVVGVDESRSFIEHLRAQAASRGLPQLTGVVGDVQRLLALLPDRRGRFDFAWARWVLCFVPDPEAVVAGVAALLRPGGRFAVHDYFNYATSTIAPRRASYDRVIAATQASWRAAGGDPDVAARVPRMMAAHGLDVEHLAIHQRVARPGDSMFAWPDTWWRSYAPKLVEMGHITAEECAAVIRDLDDLAASPTDFILPPPVTEILAVKR